MNVVLRADAGPRTGTGHFVRSTTLAGACVEAGGTALLVTACENPRLLRGAQAAGCTVQRVPAALPAAAFVAIADEANADRVVLDGYHYDREYQDRIVAAGHRLLVIDDFNHLPSYRAHWILNQNYGATHYAYTAEPRTRLLLGTSFVLLKPAFLEYRGLERTFPATARNLLVTIGGGEQGAAALRILEALERIGTLLRVRVVVGAEAGAAARDRLEAAGAASRHAVEVIAGCDDLAPLMAWADAAVCASGTTVWELAFMGLPALLVTVAQNQEGIAARLGRDGYALAAGRIDSPSSADLVARCDDLVRRADVRESLSHRCRTLVDGEGARRVADALAEG